MNENFLDSSFAVALASRTDEYPERALRLAREVELNKRTLVTTVAIIFEVGNALSRPPNRATAIHLITQLQLDPDTVITPVSDGLLADAMEMFSQYSDKTWGLVDCLSFLVMRERGITDALTADRHFQQAGFRALLLDED